MPIIGNIIKGFIDVRDKLSNEKKPIDVIYYFLKPSDWVVVFSTLK